MEADFSFSTLMCTKFLPTPVLFLNLYLRIYTVLLKGF